MSTHTELALSEIVTAKTDAINSYKRIEKAQRKYLGCEYCGGFSLLYSQPKVFQFFFILRYLHFCMKFIDWITHT